MPGVIMENGSRNGSHTNHDRDTRPNGINGGGHTSDKMQDKAKSREPLQGVTPTSPFASNGLNGSFTGDAPRQEVGQETSVGDVQNRSYALPPEINHITQGYIELKAMLSRLAQKTHKDLVNTITELSQMPLPASTTNGNGSHSSALEDNSAENVNKKVHLLKFLENAHDSWTKALVIAGWSRRAEEVSKIIDLNVHLNNIKQIYLNILGQMGTDKQELTAARLLNPDLRTALEVLTTGKASWMPDLGYIGPPPLTAKEILKSLEKLNTLLSIRLNLSDYNTIPIHFKNYTIQSGRATFIVAGEYEVDLTIAEEDPEAQFWFIDFRFLFKPAATNFSPQIRFHIESKVNEILLKDGLAGCYKYLHELVLTHKITEYKKQAIDLARGNWIETLAVEPLNRSLCIQYWLNKHDQPSPTRSWFILGVGSAKRKTAGPKSRATSHLFLRWFRDAKEVDNFHVPFDSVNISTESLLKSIIAKHVAYILESIHDKLSATPLFLKRELGLSSSISHTEPAESYLNIQLTNEQTIRVQIEPITGRVILSPASPAIARWEHKLNSQCKDLAEMGHTFIEQLRYALIDEAITSHAMSVGWARIAPPLLYKQSYKDGLQKAYATWLPSDHSAVLWFTRRRWNKGWYLTAFPSMSGEHWLLIRIAAAPSAQDKPGNKIAANVRSKHIDPKIASYIQLPITVASPDPSYGFMSSLHVFAAGIVSHYANLQVLHSRRCAYMVRKSTSPRAINMPAICFRIKDILPQQSKVAQKRKNNVERGMRLTFHGIETIPQLPKPSDQGLSDSSTPSQIQVSRAAIPVSQSSNKQIQRDENVFAVIEAQMILPGAIDLTNLDATIDRDIAFNPKTGAFAFRLRCAVGEPIIDRLLEVVVRVERLVDFATVIKSHKKLLKAESTLLGKITFTYGSISSNDNGESMDVDNQLGAYRATIDFTAPENSMTLIFEKGNPHIRIIDFLASVLNSTQGLHGVASLLAQTLPVNRGLDTITRNWPMADGPDDNEMFVNVRATDWYTIRYNIRQITPEDSKIEPVQRKVSFSVKLRDRHGEPWWFVERGGDSSSDEKRERDVVDDALLSVWSSSGVDWYGMKSSAVARKSGIEHLLEKLDEAMRQFALAKEISGDVLAAPLQVTAPAPASAPKPNQAQISRQQQQQRQQLQTPNQSQSQGQSQGRSQAIKREVVEID